VVVGADGPDARKYDLLFHSWFETWLREHRGKIVAQERIRLLATGDPSPWYLVEIP
jgi:hypothetical protein